MSMAKCFYCDDIAVYDDVVVNKDTYQMGSVCKKHFSVSLVS